jgi:folate-binding protein YgfZ
MIKDESEQWGLLCLVGPKAVTCVGEALALHGDMLIDENKVIIPPDCSAWNLWKSERWAVPAIYLLLPRGQCQEAFNLMRAVDVPPVGKLAIDLVRLEAGIPEYGLEIDGQHILLEADLDDTFSREKGCYPGQEVIERISAYGNGKTPYKLNIYKIDSDVNSIDKITVDEDDRPVKQVMRFFYDPSENRTVVAAYVENR